MKSFKFISRMISVFGLVMLFAVSGWGWSSNTPTISLSCTPTSLNEGNSGTQSITCTVSINVAPNNDDLKLTIKTSDNTAKTNNNDYEKLDKDFEFSKNTTTLQRTFSVTVNGDTAVESDETFVVSVVENRTDKQNFTLPPNQTITIRNDDIALADLSITKTVNNATPLVGDEVTFTIVGKNNGPTTTEISITDTLPAGLSWVSDSDNGQRNFDCTNSGNRVTCTGSQNFSTNDTVTVTIVAKVTSAGVIVNSANIASTQSVTDNITTNNSASATITAKEPFIDLLITKTVDSPVAKVGDEVTFTIIGTNKSSFSTQMEIIDTLPTGLTYVSVNENKSNFSCTRSAQVITCNGSRNFSTNESVTITIVATVAASGTWTNSATIKGTSGTSIVGTATATVTGDTGALSISDASLIEGDSGSSPMTFTVSLDALNPTQDVKVNYASSNATAIGGTSCTSGVDYITKSGTATITKNTLSTTFQVLICGDTTDTVDETFNVTLSTPVNASIDGATGVGTINDDDGIIIGSNDMCYDTPTTSGICLNIVGLNCKVTTTIRNKSGVSLENVKVIKAYEGINMSFVSAIGIDDVSKTLATDSDNAETNAALSVFGSNFDFSTTYNKGVVYRPDTSSPWGTSESHSIYDTSAFGFSLSTMKYVAQYTKGGKTYQSQLASCSINTSSPNTRDFTKTFSANINGNMQIIGNSVLLSKDSSGNLVCAPATTNNNSLTLKYANKDTSTSAYTRFNSTSSNLSLPDGVVADDIKWAGLYWQGRLSSSSSKKTNGQTVLFKTPAMSDYVTVVTDPSKFNWTTSQFEYQGVADITAYMKAGLSGTYWVANVNAEEMSNGYGAWSLVIVYKDNKVSLKNMSVYDGFMGIYKGATGTNGIYNDKPVILSGFLTPTNGDVNSKFLLFGGEGDISLADSVTMTNNTNTSKSLGSNVFNSSQQIEGVNVTTRNPSCANTIGVDIDTFNVGTTSATTPIIGNSQTTTTITLTSGGDEYFPGVFAFSTELYVPDVCYLENVAYNNQPITATNLPATGDNVEFEVTITNKNNEVAKGVFIEKEFDKPKELTYVSSSMKIAPIPGTTYAAKSDTIGDDTAEYNTTSKTAKFLLGALATSGEGGTIVKDAITKFKYGATVRENNATENTYLVSYRNDLLQITFTGIPIRKCQDFNNSFGVAGLLGAFNVVNEFGGNSDFDDATNSETYLVTQVAGKPFNVKVISLNVTGDALANSSSDINVSLIQTPNYASCSEDAACMQNLCNIQPIISAPTNITFNGGSSMPLNNVIHNNASRNVSFKVTYNNGTQYACSLDSFAIRPDRFILSAPTGEDIELLTSARDYNLSLTAPRYASTTPSSDYNVSDVNDTSFDLNQTLYQKDGSTDPGLLGTLSFSSTTFNITNGVASNAVGINFDDVGKVNIKLIDNTWAAVDTSNNDTVANCSATGAYICGEVNATFIPASFALSAVSLFNNNSNTFTYLSNDLNMSAHVNVTITAKNDLNGTTQNFDQYFWENPVNVFLNPPAITGMTSHKDDANETLYLGFITGAFTIPWNETNTSKKLMFNYLRDANKTINPYEVNGSSLTVNTASTYTSSSAVTKTVVGSSVADQNATFVYGRTNAPRQRFTGKTGTAFIYYEVFCSGTSCNKSFLPDGLNSQSTNDPRWFKNTLHSVVNSGNVGTIIQKGGTGTSSDIVDATAATGTNPDNTTLSYDESKDYPYKTTMQNTPSSWLVYNQYKPANNTLNEFEVEFESTNSSWAGVHETNTTTNVNASTKTNRRSMW